jgi:hypothetical protein
MATEERNDKPEERSEVSHYLAKIGRKGGLKGNKARADSLKAKKRKEIANRATAARWSSGKS